MLPQDIDLTKITRLEVIDSNGRSYTKLYCSVELVLQDDGKTLKVFVDKLFGHRYFERVPCKNTNHASSCKQRERLNYCTRCGKDRN